MCIEEGSNTAVTYERQGDTFLPEKPGRLWVRVKYSGLYTGSLLSNQMTVTKQSENRVPDWPSLATDAYYDRVFVQNYDAAVEYMLVGGAPSSGAWPTSGQHSDGKTVNANGHLVFGNLTQGSTYTVYARYKETETHNAGVYVQRNSITLAADTNVYLNGIRITASNDEAVAGEKIKLTAEPVPGNARDFGNGVTWSISGQGSGVWLYTNEACTAVYPGGARTEVWLKSNNANNVVVRAEKQMGPSTVYYDTKTISYTGADGQHSFENMTIFYKNMLTGAENSVTLEQGESVVIELYQRIGSEAYPVTKPYQTAKWNPQNAGQFIDGVVISPIDGTNQFVVRAFDNCKIGSANYLLTIFTRFADN